MTIVKLALAVLGGITVAAFVVWVVGGTVGTRLGRRRDRRQPATEVHTWEALTQPDYNDDSDEVDLGEADIDAALAEGVCPVHPGKPADGSECTCTWPTPVNPMTAADVDAVYANIFDGTPLPERVSSIPAKGLDELRAMVAEARAEDLRQAERDQLDRKPWTDPNAEVDPDPRRFLGRRAAEWDAHLGIQQADDRQAREEQPDTDHVDEGPTSPWDAMPPGFGQAKRVNGSAS